MANPNLIILAKLIAIATIAPWQKVRNVESWDTGHVAHRIGQQEYLKDVIRTVVHA